jgi:hypothetical protein
MPKLQAQLALYGAIDEALVADHDPTLAETVEKFLPGTTGFGQRGWYRDVQRFLNVLSPGGRAALPDLDAARGELLRTAREAGELPPAVTARSILAEVVLGKIPQFRDEKPLGEIGPLSRILSVAAAPSTEADSEGPGTVGSEVGAELARQIEAEVSSLASFRAFMSAQSDDTISAAVATYEPRAFLRKVRGEYCSVITTEAQWTDVTLDELQAVVDPGNWDDFYREFFCRMSLQGETAQGWSAMLEEVSGDCDQYSLTTPLKFWKKLGQDELFLNYDLDEANTADVDRLVLVDNGYIWITRVGTGVRVRTSKELLIRGLSATATTALAGGLGWADNASGMFRHGAKHPPASPVVFTNSKPTAAAMAMTAPSSGFPVDPPTLPADIRREGVDDAVKELTAGIASLAQLGAEFVSRWRNGIDAKDIEFLGGRLGAIMTERSVALFDTASSNFRPAPVTPSPPVQGGYP